jgi:hypothetical protein
VLFPALAGSDASNPNARLFEPRVATSDAEEVRLRLVLEGLPPLSERADTDDQRMIEDLQWILRKLASDPNLNVHQIEWIARMKSQAARREAAMICLRSNAPVGAVLMTFSKSPLHQQHRGQSNRWNLRNWTQWVRPL